MHKYSILVADDEKHTLAVLGLMLRSNGHKVTCVEDGNKAYWKIINSIDENNPFDLLLTDFQMPNLNGLELVAKLHERSVELPVIMMTAYATRELVLKLAKFGCEDCITKPLLPDEVIKKINTVLEKNSIHDKISVNLNN